MNKFGRLLISFRKPVIQTLQDWFSVTYKVGTGILDEHARPLTFEANHHQYCRTLRRTPRGIHRCRNSDACLMYESKRIKDVAWHVCENGLLDLAVPIVVGNSIVAYFFAGQLRGHFAGLDTSGSLGKIKSITKSCGVELKKQSIIIETLKKEYESVPVRSPKELAELDEAARQFANLLSWIITKTEEWDPQGDRLREYLHQAIKARTVDQLLVLSIRSLPYILGGKHCSIFLVGKDVEYGQRLILRKTSYQKLKAMESSGFYTKGQGLTGWVWKTGRSLRLRNGCDEAELAAIDLDDPPVPSGHLRDSKVLKEFICVPIFDQSKHVVGVIRIVTKSGGFTREDEMALSTLGDYLYSLIKNCQNREKEADVKKVLESALKFQQCTCEHDVWATAVSVVKAFWGAEDKAYLLNVIHKDKETLTVEEVDGTLAPRGLEKKRYQLKGTTTGYVIDKRESVLMHDLKKAEKKRKYLPVIKGGLSGIVSPLCTRNTQVFAALAIIAAKRYAFSEDDERLLLQFCEIAAGAVERIQERRKVAEYEKLVTVSRFLTGLQHDLCSPMQAIDLYLRKHKTPEEIELLSEFILTGLLAYRFLPVVSSQERSLGLETSLKERVSLFRKDSFFLRPLIDKCIKVIDKCFSSQPECLISCSKAYKVKADYQLLLLVIYNLIKNARENAKTAQLRKKKIIISVRRTNGWTKIRVSDSNNRIPKRIRDSMFRFQEQPESALVPGVGLALANLFVQAHPGPSEKGQGVISYVYARGCNVFSIIIAG